MESMGVNQAEGSYNIERDGKIGVGEKLAYGIGDFGSNMVYANIAAFLTFFYTDVVGMAGAIVGTVMFTSRIFDGISDIVVGTLVDRTKNRYGKARPWVMRSAVPMAITLVLLFSVPNFGETGNVVYLFIVYNLVTTVFYTMYAIPHGTQVALITQDQYERSVLNICRMVAGTSGAIVVNVLTVPLVTYFGSDAGAWRTTYILYGVVAVIAIFITFYFTKERVTPRKVTKEKIPFKVGIKTLFANKYWRLVLVLGMVTYGIMALSGANIYYVIYILGDEGLMSSLMIFYFASSILGMIIMTPVIKRRGKRNTVFMGFLVYLIGTVVILASPYSITNVYTGLFIKGLGLAPLLGSLPSFIADTIEYGEWKTGKRVEGLVYSSESFGQKFGNGLSSALLGWLLTLSGYVGGAAVQTDSAISVIIALFTFVPLGFYTVAAGLLIFYKLDKEYNNILEELNKR